jgi:intracellular multiplication protein IcmN
LVASEDDQLRQLSDAKRWKLRWAVVLACYVALTACTSLQALPKHSAETHLTDRGIQLITQGDDYLLSIPGRLLFYDHSPRIRWEAYAVLNDVAKYLRLYRKVSVQVTALSAPYRYAQSAERTEALTRAQAEAVANYLWSQDIRARFIYAYGQRSLNSRVEITFKEVVA